MRATRKLITNEEQLREIIGQPHPINLAKTIHHLDEHASAFIASSPFCLIASYNSEHHYLDVSPRGDDAGFVWVSDANTFYLPERPGNKLAVTLLNILTNPSVSIIFLIPGKKETLRIRGKAKILKDDELSQQFIVNGKAPALVLEVSMDDVYFHCAKCMMRSRLWQPDSWPVVDSLPNLATVLATYSHQKDLYENIHQAVNKNYTDELY